jgi:hypothetical protein
MAVGGFLKRVLCIFQAAVGAFWASTAAAPSTASVVGRARPLAKVIALPVSARWLRGLVYEPIENCRRGWYIAEKDAPILRRSVRSDQVDPISC